MASAGGAVLDANMAVISSIGGLTMEVCLERFSVPGPYELTRPVPQVTCPRCGTPSTGLCRDCRLDHLAYEVQYMSTKEFLDRLDDTMDGCQKNFFAEARNTIALEYYETETWQLEKACELLEAKGCTYNSTKEGVIIYLQVADFL